MPITVIRVCGSVRHIRPLPSDSTTPIVPVSATAKFAPLIATRADRNLRRRCSRAAPARTAGSSVRSGSTPLISSRKIRRISERFRWIAGTRMWLGLSCPSCTMQLGQVGLPRGDPGGLEGLVERDLLRGHRLDLDDLVGARRLHEVGDDPVGLVGVAGPVHDAAARGDRRLELLQVRGQVGHRVDLELPARLAQLLPVRELGDHGGPLGADRPGRVAEVGPQLGVGERVPGGRGKALVAAQVPDAAGRGRRDGRHAEHHGTHARPSSAPRVARSGSPGPPRTAGRASPRGSGRGARSRPRSGSGTGRRRCA